MRREEAVAGQVSTTRRAAIIPAARTGPLALIWWWRYEIGLALCVPVAVVWAMDALGWYWVVLAVALLALLVGAVPVVRAGVWGRIRCVFTAHRIRSGCVEALVVAPPRDRFHGRRGGLALDSNGLLVDVSNPLRPRRW